MHFYQNFLDYAHQYAHVNGLDYDTACEYFGFNEEKFLLEAKNIAIPYLITEQIFRAEGLAWTQDEYDAMFDSFVQDLVTNYEWTEEDATAYVTNNQIDNVYADLTYQTVVKWLIETTFR